MKSFTKQYEIAADVTKVWQALVNPEIISQWMGETVSIGDQVGDTFSFWSNSIWGKNIEVEKEKKLKQEWFGGNWNEPSIVKFLLTTKDGITHVELIHENLPEGEADSFNQGWDDFYMGPLKQLCEK